MNRPEPGVAAPAPLVGQGERSIGWDWVWIGVGVGVLLVATAEIVVGDQEPRPGAAILVGALTVALTGILVGYRSPGNTILEGGLTGLVLGVAGSIVLAAAGVPGPTSLIVLGGGVAGATLCLVGTAVGEVLQGTVAADEPSDGLQWAWIGVGTLFGLLLNAYAVFVPQALLGFGGMGVLLCFLVSFVLAGFFVGLFSPGITVLEPAVAGLFIVVLDVMIVVALFGAFFPLLGILAISVLAFLGSLLGGAVGEVAQRRWLSPRRRRAATG